MPGFIVSARNNKGADDVRDKKNSYNSAHDITPVKLIGLFDLAD